MTENKGQRTEKSNKSAQAFTEACNYLPGGVNSPVRAFGGVDIGPLFIERAVGSKIYDIDGNEYIDYVGSWGPMILGHAHPAVIKAIGAATKKGTSFGAPTLAETALAKKIIAAFDSIEKVRLVSSGTEAVMTAIRLARAYTKKDLVIKMAGCYHGHSDSLLVAAGSGLAEKVKKLTAESAENAEKEKNMDSCLRKNDNVKNSAVSANSAVRDTTASSAGVPDSIVRMTVVIPYNDIEAAKTAFDMHKGQIAAVLVEPVAANMGVVPPIDGYLATLRNLCDQNEALLIFDEVITGFRLAAGGAQELFGVKADIICLGKIIGGGLPAAAFGGRADIMALLAPAGPVYQAGTLSGNPIATAAANATLDLLDARCWILDSRRVSSYEYLESRTALLEAGLANAAKDAGIAVTINRVGSIMSCFFTYRPVRNFADVQSTNIKQFKRFFAEMLKQGVYLAPSAYEAMFVSLAHSQHDIEKTIEAAENIFRKIKGEKFQT